MKAVKMKKISKSRASNAKWKELELISAEVDTWPQWKINLSGIESNYKAHVYPKTIRERRCE